MASFENITVGSNIIGLAGNEPVTILGVKWHGSSVIEVTFKDHNGHLSSQLLFQD